MRAARAATATASPASGPSTSRAGATSWDRTSAAAPGVAGSRWWRAAPSARLSGAGRRGSPAGSRAPAAGAGGSWRKRSPAGAAPPPHAARARARTARRASGRGPPRPPARAAAPRPAWSLASRDEPRDGRRHVGGGDVTEAAVMAERTRRRARRRAGAATQVLLQHGGGRAVGEEPELLDRWSEQRDHGRPDAGGHMHDAGIPRDGHGGSRQQGPGFLERELARGARPRAAGGELLGEPAILRPADAHGSEAGAAQRLDERAPVCDGPALGRVGGARGEGRELRVRESALDEPMRHALGRSAAEPELRGAAVGARVEPSRGLEIALRHRDPSPIGVELGGDEQRAGRLAFAVPRPATVDQQAQRDAADAPVEVEPVGWGERRQPAREMA